MNVPFGSFYDTQVQLKQPDYRKGGRFKMGIPGRTENQTVRELVDGIGERENTLRT